MQSLHDSRMVSPEFRKLIVKRGQIFHGKLSEHTLSTLRHSFCTHFQHIFVIRVNIIFHSDVSAMTLMPLQRTAFTVRTLNLHGRTREQYIPVLLAGACDVIGQTERLNAVQCAVCCGCHIFVLGNAD